MKSNKYFRAWDKLEKRYIYSDTPNQQHYILTLDGKFYNLQNGSGGDDYVVEQWTGLVDNQGVRIYEGDIVRFDYTACCKIEGERKESEEEYEIRDFHKLFNVLLSSEEVDVNGSEYSTLYTGFLLKQIYCSDERTNYHLADLEKLSALGKQYNDKEYNCGQFGYESKELKVVGNINELN